MKSIPTFTDFAELEKNFEEWFFSTFEPGHKIHGPKVAEPIPKESAFWRSLMLVVCDAHTWAKDIEPDAEDYENQAVGILTESMTVAQAKGKAHRFIRTHKALKRLGESADRKLSCLQSLTKN